MCCDVCAEHVRSPSAADVLPHASQQASKDVPFIELPAHAARDSLLHSGSGFDNYRGLYNLALLALAVSSLRVAYENLSKLVVVGRDSFILKNCDVMLYPSKIK